LCFPPYSGGFIEPIVLVGMPTLVQAKKVLWKPVLSMLRTLAPDAIRRIDLTNSVIHLNGGLPSILFEGLNDGNGDRVRGQRIVHAAIDEAQAVRSVVIDEVVLPAMADTPGSTALFTGTPPNGTTNIMHKLYQMGLNTEGWRSWTRSMLDNPHVPISEVMRLKTVLPEKVYKREVEGPFTSFAGQIFESYDPKFASPVDWIRDAEFFIIGHDCGDVNPAVVQVAAVNGPTGYQFGVTKSVLFGDGQSTVSEKTVEQFIANLWHGDPRHKYCFVDPSRPLSIMHLRDLGIRQAAKGYNKIASGIGVVESLFHQRRLEVPIGAEHLRVKLTNYHRARSREGAILDAIEDGQDDHEIDSLRYALASLPRHLLNVH
jgi:hypothetical protein